MKIETYLGNLKLLKEHKTAFICSRQIPAGIVLKSYDWAIARREAGDCVISGFQSPIEKDVFHFLIKGKQPVILVLARGMIREIPLRIQMALDEQRLLIISPFSHQIKRISNETAMIRNQFTMELADEVFIPYCTPGGTLEKMLQQYNGKIVKIGFDEIGQS